MLLPRVRVYDFDQDLLAQVRQTGQPGVAVYPFAFPAVVAGRGSDPDKEINLSLCTADGIPVFRRMGGGCAVFLDPGTLIVSIVLPAKGFAGIQRLFNFCNQLLIRGFAAMGLTGIFQDGISDLVLADRKVGGSSFYRSKGIAYYTASLLVSTDLDVMERYLPHPPREPVYRRKRSHREFVTCLDRAFPGLTMADLSAQLG
ncbi:MAG: lipoate--protein ligase family protein, partial [Desulfobacteraceae bacterium]|nr:lipoate--protein ligase family protein [Desulfobacteraceae bacterium]